MRRLRKRQRVDTLKTELRPRKRGRIGRYVYLGLLLVLFLALFDFLAGDLLYLRAEGMLSRDISVVAPEYASTVLDLKVEDGDHVVRGEVVAEVRSQRIVNDIARLSADLADAEIRLSEMRISKRKLAALLPSARARADETEADRVRLKSMKRSGLVTAGRRTEAVDDAYRALAEFTRLQAEAELLSAEYPKMQKAVEKARAAQRELLTLYNEGRLTAPANGVVAGVSVSEGSGVDEGRTVMEIFRGEPYVLAYVPVGTLYQVRPGDAVVLRYGLRFLRGRISALLPLASRLPQEFQRAFQTAQRQQLVRIRLEPSTAILPPLFTKVAITWPWALPALAARVASVLGDEERQWAGAGEASSGRCWGAPCGAAVVETAEDPEAAPD